MEVNNSSAARQALNMISERAAASSVSSAAASSVSATNINTEAAAENTRRVANSSATSQANNQSTGRGNNHVNNLLGSIENSEIVSDGALYRSIEAANRAMFGTDRRLEYEIHEYTNTVMVRVLDSITDEIIRELPPQSRLDALAKVWQMVGIIVDDEI